MNLADGALAAQGWLRVLCLPGGWVTVRIPGRVVLQLLSRLHGLQGKKLSVWGQSGQRCWGGKAGALSWSLKSPMTVAVVPILGSELFSLKMQGKAKVSL